MTGTDSIDSDIWPQSLRASDTLGRLLMGSFGLLVRAGRSAVSATDRTQAPSSLGDAVDAAVGLGMAVQRRVFDVAAAVAVPIEAASTVLVRVAAAGGNTIGMRFLVWEWAERGRAEQRQNEAIARQMLRDHGPAVVNSLIDALDVDAILTRVDLNAVVAQIDVAELVRRVLDEIDVGQLVRESSSTMVAETADAVRLETMRADWALSRLVDRVLRRTVERQTGLLAES
jgi:hypothetical protein